MEQFDKDLHDEGLNRPQSPSRWGKLTSAWRNKANAATMKQWVSQSRKQIVLSVTGVAVMTAAIWGGTAYVDANTITFLNVYRGNELVGTVSTQDDLKRMYAVRLEEVQEKHPNAIMEIDTSAIHTVADAKYKAEPATEETLSKLKGQIPAYAAAIELKVNGEAVGYVKDQTTADQILAQAKAKYDPDHGKRAGQVRTLSATRSTHAMKAVSRVESVTLRERVATVDKKIDPNKVLTPVEAMSMLTTGSTRPVKYEVKKGDTVSSIARDKEVSIETIYRNNPSVGEEFIQIGQVLDLTEPKPLITVKTVEAYSEYLVTEPQKIIKEDPEMKAGQSKVVRQGKQGLKRMSYRLIKDNGRLTKEEWINQEVIEPTIPEIIIRGTKVVRGEGSGTFAYPVSGAQLTSGYGTRWGRMHKGIDLVSSDRTIMASDEGVVSFAGVKNGYGNTIIINHRNGYETLYGHLSEININVGDIVEKGQAIGVMGSTGNSTGTHLHFEIHKGDDIENPLKYL
ncbi:M23 family metallopeptidase [Paenibacillus sp. ACRRX]|uniref:M23 family metallopeptidase n=1 Tax=unclassified Paenibacillus TaxID=185978 RepID=UPI001EF4D221|nr:MULTISPECIES: M23 family metallopeptidase [unclassified Paenibacillus]MCG7408361.1 M23 family metallopeptidase [Paenibacillus sp. ACRRX]MDK8181254.1 M23 family metallopeptidase [Paenibacillus sp. UMB4589-SE434]